MTLSGNGRFRSRITGRPGREETDWRRNGKRDRALATEAEQLVRSIGGEIRRELLALAERKEALEAEIRNLEGLLQRRRKAVEKALRRRFESAEAEGFRKGYERGVEEGRAAGRERGRLEGLECGRAEGRREELARSAGETASALSTLEAAVAGLRREIGRLRSEALRQVVNAAIEAASAIVNREIELRSEDVLLANLERALDRAAGASCVSLEVHPQDALLLERALAEDTSLAERLRDVEILPRPGVSRGGCRVVVPGGAIDLTIEAQRERIALLLLDTLENACVGSGSEGALWKREE